MNHFQTLLKILVKGTLPNSFYEANTAPLPKPDKDNYQRRKLQANIPEEHKCKNPPKNTTNNDILMIHLMWNLFHGCKDSSKSTNQCDTSH